MRKLGAPIATLATLALLAGLIRHGVFANREPDARLAPIAVTIDAPDRRAFIVNATNSVSVIDLRTRTVLAVVPTGLAPYPAAIDVRDGRAFIPSHNDGGLTVLDSRTGRLLRRTAIGGTPRDAVVDERRRRVYVVDEGGRLAVVDARTGILLRRIDLGGQLWTAALDPQAGTLVVAGDYQQRGACEASTGCVTVVREDSGRVRARGAVPLDPTVAAFDARTGHAFVASAGIVLPFGTSPPGTLTMFDARSGRRLHTAAIGSVPSAMAVDTRSGRLFVACQGSRTVSIVDTATGVVVGATRLSYAPGALAVAEDTGLVFAVLSGDLVRTPTRDGYSLAVPPGTGGVAALDARTGRVRAFAHLAGHPGSVAVDPLGRQVLVTTGNTVSVLSAASGALLTTIPGTG